MTRSAAEDITIDVLDRQILYTVQLGPRASFSDLGAALGVSEQTVARRYRRMHAAGVVRVVGLVNPARIGRTDWIVRVHCRPDAAAPLADALSRRDDVSWVTLVSGGSEIVCTTRPDSDDQRDELLRRLPRTAQVLSFGAQAVLHRFWDDRGPDWSGYVETPEPGRLAHLPAWDPMPDADDDVMLEPDDAPLVSALTRNGRASFAELAKATGSTPARAARRLGRLLASGVLYLDVELAPALLGFPTLAYLWVTVAPAELGAAGEAMARHRQVAFCAAITGSANLMVALVCRDTADLYRYVTDQVGSVDGIRQVEISPVLRRVKQAGTLQVGPRLVSEGATRRPPGRMAGSGRGLTG